MEWKISRKQMSNFEAFRNGLFLGEYSQLFIKWDIELEKWFEKWNGVISGENVLINLLIHFGCVRGNYKTIILQYINILGKCKFWINIGEQTWKMDKVKVNISSHLQETMYKQCLRTY